MSGTVNPRRGYRLSPDNVQNFLHIFLGLARSSSPLPEIWPSWEAFAHPRSGCLLDNVQNFSHIFLGLARLNSPLPEIRPSWEAFTHPRSGCLLDNVQNFSHIFLGLARLNSPLPEIRPSWEAFAHPRSGCLLWFLVTKRILSTHETSSHEDSAPTDHFRRAGARASKCPAGAELLKGRLVQRPHIKIAFSPPFVARDVPQSRAYQHKRDVKRKFW